MFSSRKHTIDLSTTLLELRAGRLELYDVREGNERAERFVPGSRHLPLGQVKARLAELPRDKPIAFICRTGRRSAMATATARRAGYDAHNVKGGMTAWDRELDHGRSPR
jgi:rhodanese-related sulfurtransferase